MSDFWSARDRLTAAQVAQSRERRAFQEELDRAREARDSLLREGQGPGTEAWRDAGADRAGHEARMAVLDAEALAALADYEAVRR